ncbi:GNAT family N-acetyltransferase [Oceanobacter mangrovi]|uniref:GNAT family N-acetyltransferase n=1 Tax=Oceanobacter mangrovi TaxID=2862510 RepID=UPI001C8D63D4|nr:GNAT family N-acetyltransferase [Oceanobacter mangrovi]
MATFQVIQSIHAVAAEQWQQLVPNGYPFLDYRFLSALESSGCLDEDSGWQPQYLLFFDSQEQLAAALPTFIKHNSYGEYVFDWGWADAYHRHGLNYYPKLLCAAPYTPATGPRLLIHPQQQQHSQHWWRQAVIALNNHSLHNEMSGWHLNFPNLADLSLASDMADEGEFMIRRACQFHWFNRGYQSFDDFLGYFASRKRKGIKKERRKVIDAGIEMRRLTGASISDDAIRRFYRCYQMTYLNRGRQGYLNLKFFRQLLASMNAQMLLVEAWREDKHLASALYFFDQQTLYGRYWGCIDEYDSLHFEACYYQGIEFCIERSIPHFDPGTQGEHKIARGFEPVLTSSLHRLHHPAFQDAVARFVDEEFPHILRYQQEATELLPFRENAFEDSGHELNRFAP